MGSPPAVEGVLSGDEVVRLSSGVRRDTQLRGREDDLSGAGAWPWEAVQILLPGSAHGAPATCRRVLIVAGEVVRRRVVLAVQGQGLGGMPGRVRVGVHAGVLVPRLGSLSGESNCLAHFRPPCVFPACAGVLSLTSVQGLATCAVRRHTPL